MLIKDKKKSIEKAGFTIRKANKKSGYKFIASKKRSDNKGFTEVGGTSITNLYAKIFKTGYR